MSLVYRSWGNNNILWTTLSCQDVGKHALFQYSAAKASYDINWLGNSQQQKQQ